MKTNQFNTELFPTTQNAAERDRNGIIINNFGQYYFAVRKANTSAKRENKSL